MSGQCPGATQVTCSPLTPQVFPHSTCSSKTSSAPLCPSPKPGFGLGRRPASRLSLTEVSMVFFFLGFRDCKVDGCLKMVREGSEFSDWLVLVTWLPFPSDCNAYLLGGSTCSCPYPGFGDLAVAAKPHQIQGFRPRAQACATVVSSPPDPANGVREGPLAQASPAPSGGGC